MTGDVNSAAPPWGRHVQAGEHRFYVIEKGMGPNTVFLHGGGPGCTGLTDFGSLLDLFAEDRRSLLVDLLQYGKSGKPAISGPMWDFHARQLASLFDALHIDQADLICNSWGGCIALRFASLYPERARALVITGSMPVLYGPLAPLPERGARGRNARDWYYGGDGPSLEKMRELMARLEWYDPQAIPETTIRLRYEKSLDPEEIACGQVPSNRGDIQDLTEDLRNLHAPVLFMWGMFDAFLTPDYPLMLARMCPRGSLFVMPRASHHLQEERPREYAAIVRAFLKETP